MSTWLSVTAVGVFVSGFAGLHGDELEVSTPTTDEFNFDQYELVTDTAQRQTVLTGFLLGGVFAEVVVVNLDENENRQLRVYSIEHTIWSQKIDCTLRSEVLFVDIANIGGRDRIITYEPGSLRWFDPQSEAAHELLAVTCSFNPPRKNEIPHVDVTRDVNSDGLVDFVVPDGDGFWVIIQLKDTTFADPVKIGRPTDLSGIYGADGYRYNPWSQSRIHEMDHNLDGRTDLVYWSDDHFNVHLQDEHGIYAREATTFTTDVEFDSDDLFSLTSGDMTGRVLHALTDMNKDGMGDLVVFSLEGTRVSKKNSTCEVHFGARAKGGGIMFSQAADITFQADDRIQLSMTWHDFDGDSELDLMFATIERKFLKGNLWKRIKGAMGEDVWLDLEFYRAEDGHYPDTPSTTRRIALDGVPSYREPGSVSLDIALRGATHVLRKTQKSWPRAFNPTLLIGDVTGDGLAELLVSSHPRYLDVFVGIPGPNLFLEHPQSVKIAMPNDQEYTWLVDLNLDGKQDILMHHPFTQRDAHGARKQPLGTESHRVEMLIAR